MRIDRRRAVRRTPQSQTIRDWAESRVKLTPRTQLGLELYGTARVKTLKEAADLVGISPVALSLAKQSPAGQAAMQEAMDTIRDKTLSTHKLLERLSRQAVETIGTIMATGEKEENRLRAAVDLADRGSETSKIHRAEVVGLTLNAEDAKALAESMVQAASLREKYGAAAEGNFERVDTGDQVNEELSALRAVDDSERDSLVERASSDERGGTRAGAG